jgi:hypothetical protein
MIAIDDTAELCIGKMDFRTQENFLNAIVLQYWVSMGLARPYRRDAFCMIIIILV